MKKAIVFMFVVMGCIISCENTPSVIVKTDSAVNYPDIKIDTTKQEYAFNILQQVHDSIALKDFAFCAFKIFEYESKGDISNANYYIGYNAAAFHYATYILTISDSVLYKKVFPKASSPLTLKQYMNQ